MKQDKDWIDVMRSSLREAEPTPPTGGWERLERELGMVLPSRKPAWRIYLPRIAAAAAVLLLFVAGGGFLLRGDRDILKDGGVAVPVADGGGNAVNIAQPAQPDAGLEKQVAEVYLREVARQAGSSEQVAQHVGIPRVETRTPESAMASTEVPAQSAAVSAQPVVEPDDAEVKNPANGADARAGEPKAGEQKKNAENSASRKAEYTPARTENRTNSFIEEPESSRKRRGSGVSAGLFAGGNMSGGTEKGVPARMFAGMIVGGDAVVVQKFAYSDFSYRHHLPLSFGLTLRKELPYGLSVESGVNYTLLRSDVRAMNNSKNFTQKLHFIGVPLRLNWQFLERGGFSLYIGAGGMLEKCVGAKFGSNSVDVPGLQWSVTGAVGAQYKLGRVVGLYFEPEVSYYFTETELRTSRTDAPLSVALRLGVRFSF